jgi:PAS domain S-box-containing protein
VATEDISRLFLASLLSIAPEAIIAVDDEQRITTFNEGAENTFGWRRDEVLGQHLNVLLPERFRASHIDRIRQFGTAPDTARLMGQRTRIFGLHKDGNEFPAEAAICKIIIGPQRIYSVLLRDITVRQRQELQSRLLMNELDHRVRNILTRVQVMIQRSGDEGGSLVEAREALSDRLQSLMISQELISQTNWRGVAVADLIAHQLKPYLTSHNSRIEGPAIVLNPNATHALSMVFHELTTNAVKYGALSVPEGSVTVSWRREAFQATGEELVLRWSEKGGPAVKLPHCEGYGTQLIRELLKYEFDGAVNQRYAPEGLTCEIVLPLDRLLAKHG